MNTNQPNPGLLTTLLITLLFSCVIQAQESKEAPAVPLYRIPPEYPVPYGVPEREDVLKSMMKVLAYLESTTPMEIETGQDRKTTVYPSSPVPGVNFKKGDFYIVSYEWGVTYAGMLLAGEVFNEPRFTAYTRDRLEYIRAVAELYRPEVASDPEFPSPVRSVLLPHSLDDAGSMCAAMIKAELVGTNTGLDVMIENYMRFITEEEYRLPDGTLARRGVQPNTIWLDDLFMSVPALAWMGKLSGDQAYFDDAARQVLQFSERMFNPGKGLYMHTWSEAMGSHPEFRWGRANGWAIMAIVELLEVLPESHPDREAVLICLQNHMHGLLEVQHGSGFWHQLLDRNDSYLETSATAIFTYAFARAVNRGYVDPAAYGPAAILGWNAISTRINSNGQVTGTCVGTGMGFDYAFYYYRPQSPYAAHGYGPFLLAGSEIARLLEQFNVTDEHMSVQVYPKEK